MAWEDILKSKKIKCNMCGWKGKDEDLVMFKDKDGFGQRCPKCKTDAYLMDIE